MNVARLRTAMLLTLITNLLGCAEDALPIGANDAMCLPAVRDFALPPPPDLALPLGTGDPCARDADCVPGVDGPAICRTRDESGLWPDGYCTSACRIEKNDAMTAINPDCPGGAGTCRLSASDAGVMGRCFLLCGVATSSQCRFQYHCGQQTSRDPDICLPSIVRRDCDPDRMGSCGAGKVCVHWLSDVQGEDQTSCEEACNLLATPRPGCNCQRDQLGEGFCTDPTPPDMGSGSSCYIRGGNYNNCPAGYGCLMGYEKPWACWRYCTPDTAHSQCSPCATCEDVKIGVGICSSSN